MKKFISWNVNGLRACVTKGFMDFFSEIDADAVCLQETKLQEGQIDLDLEGYYQYWNYAEKRAIPERRSFAGRSRFLSAMVSGSRSTTKRAGSLPRNLGIITLSPATPLILKTS